MIGRVAAPVASFSHAYDSRGNLSTLAELTGTKAFGYDATERLTGVTGGYGDMIRNTRT